MYLKKSFRPKQAKCKMLRLFKASSAHFALFAYKLVHAHARAYSILFVLFHLLIFVIFSINCLQLRIELLREAQDLCEDSSEFTKVVLVAEQGAQLLEDDLDCVNEVTILVETNFL